MQTAETIMKSVAARVVFAPKEFSDAREISDDLGSTTVKVKSHSKPSPFSFGNRQSRSTSVTLSQHARQLLLPQEVKEIGAKSALVFLENCRPIRCSKIRYFRDRNFAKRLMPPPALPARRRQVASSATSLHLYEAPPLGDSLAPEETPNPQEVTSMDIAHLDDLVLDDLPESIRNFRASFKGDRPTESELQSEALRLIETMRE